MPTHATNPTPSPQVFVGGRAGGGSAPLGSVPGADAETPCLPEAPFIAQLISDRRPLNRARIQRPVDQIARHPQFMAWNTAIAPGVGGVGETPLA